MTIDLQGGPPHLLSIFFKGTLLRINIVGRETSQTEWSVPSLLAGEFSCEYTYTLSPRFRVGLKRWVLCTAHVPLDTIGNSDLQGCVLNRVHDMHMPGENIYMIDEHSRSRP